MSGFLLRQPAEPREFMSVRNDETELHIHLADGRRVPVSYIVQAAERLLGVEARLAALEGRP